jgi:hypothetical protein
MSLSSARRHSRRDRCSTSSPSRRTTLLSLAPSYLKYTGKYVFVVVGTALAVLANIALTWTLADEYGDLGAAFAYGIPIVVLYLVFAAVSMRDVRRLLA